MTVIIDTEQGHRLERVRYFPRQLIGADDLNQEQRYHRQKLRNHNRFLHGWGVVCGCDVQPVGDVKMPWVLRICRGYIIAPQGDEIWISTEAHFDLTTCLITSEDPCAFSRPCPPLARRALETTTVHLAVRYVECQARPVRVAPVGCGCDDADCEYSRIQDGYEFTCLTELPRTHARVSVDCGQLCERDLIMPCPDCPDDPWVVLATVKLPERGRPVRGITFTNRQPLRSTATLQVLTHCLCEGGSTRPVDPDPVDPGPVDPGPIDPTPIDPTSEHLTVGKAAIVHFEFPGEMTTDDFGWPFDGPDAALTVSESDKPNGVEIHFSTAVDRNSVTDKTFHVRPALGTRIGEPVDGTYAWFEEDRVVRFEAAAAFEPGLFEVTLVSHEPGDAIVAADGQETPLDGDPGDDPTAWPTGDGTPYGSCRMRFEVTPGDPF